MIKIIFVIDYHFIYIRNMHPHKRRLMTPMMGQEYCFQERLIVSHEGCTMPQKQFIECPFCSGLVEPRPGRQECPECHAGFVYDKNLESIFVDTSDLRLPINGTVCTRCGMVQSEKARRCGNCGGKITDTQH